MNTVLKLFRCLIAISLISTYLLVIFGGLIGCLVQNDAEYAIGGIALVLITVWLSLEPMRNFITWATGVEPAEGFPTLPQWWSIR